jgi:protein arginine N-methyltransferase 7
MQYLHGELPVEEGLVLPLLASHNTVRMRFDIEAADYLHLMKPDASFPHYHFSMLADEGRLQAYDRVIRRAVAARKEQDGEVHVLDVGTGTGRISERSMVLCNPQMQ